MSTSSAAASTNTGSDAHAQPPTPASSVKMGTSAQKLVADNAVVVFGRRGCCMCHVVKLLLLGLGVNPPVVEVDEQEEAVVIDQLSKFVGVDEGKVGPVIQFPAVFVSGKMLGGLEVVMATHISGELIPILKQAGALWL